MGRGDHEAIDVTFQENRPISWTGWKRRGELKRKRLKKKTLNREDFRKEEGKWVTFFSQVLLRLFID
jgi:hypothetical protein